MSNDESNLEKLLADGMDRVRTALDAVEDGELPDEKADAVRETADAVAEEVDDASLDELLTAAGFEDVSDDVAPPELPILIQDADADAVLGLRNLLELADLSEKWSTLDETERIDRLERIGGDGTSSDDGRSVSDLLSSVLSTGDSDEETSEKGSEGDESEGDEETESEEDETESDETESSEGSEGDGDGETETEEEENEESSSVKESLTELRSLFDAAGGEDESADEETEETEEESDEEESDDESGRDSGSGGSTSGVSTMPSSRPDMGGTSRHSTMPDKN
ncbi:hypothetical protein [Haladaptatus sp. NG-WS-4]